MRPPGSIVSGSIVSVWALLLAACLAGACERPASFTEIDLDEARRLVETTPLIVAVEPGEDAPGLDVGAIPWEVAAGSSPTPPKGLPAGPVLIVASTEHVGYRSAAALARRGNAGVRVVIVGSAEDRRRLYAGAHEPEESPLDTDS